MWLVHHSFVRCRGVVCRGKSGLKKLLDVKRSTRNRLKYSFIEYDCFYEDSAFDVLKITVIDKELADPSDPWIRVLS